MRTTNIPKIMEISDQYSNNSVICNMSSTLSTDIKYSHFIYSSLKNFSILRIENYRQPKLIEI